MRMLSNKHLLALGCQISLLSFITPSYGAAIQIFTGINYANPALLTTIKKAEFLVGTDYGTLHLKFNGTSNGTFGTANSQTSNTLSYSRFSYRVSPEAVVALAVTQPLIADITWGANEFISSSSVHTEARSVNIAPRFSYQVTKQLALGAGLDILHSYGNQLNFQVPNLGVVVNDSSGHSLGFDIGALYFWDTTTFISASFYSKQQPNTSGISTSTSGLINDKYSLVLVAPSVTELNLIKQVTKELLLSGAIYYSNWTLQRSFELKNSVVGDLSLPTFWRDVWSFELAGKYDYNDTVSILFAGLYETNFAQPLYNVPAYPGSPALTLAAGLAIHLSKELTGQLTYAHVMFTPDANLQSATDQGNVEFNLNIVGARFTYAFS